jgi:tryptophanyl-tRNA synthetase
VSGDLHLGHVALLAVAEALAKYLKTRMIVSLNEVESVCSRDTALSEVLGNKKKIAGWLIQNGAMVHSRAEDSTLLMFALRIWKMVLADKNKYAQFAKNYEHAPDAPDTLSIMIMAVAPLFVALGEKANSILMVYGEDERAHLDYIYSLYKTVWFEREVKKVFGVNPPDVNYMITKLLPDIFGKYKMSKTRPRTAISVEMLADSEGDLRLPENIYYYLQDLISILAPLPRSGQNPWLGLIGKVGF